MSITNLKTRFNFLDQVLDENMKTLKKTSATAAKQAFAMKLTLVIFSASITLILGLKIEDVGPQIALVLSSILIVLTTMDQFLGVTTRHNEINHRYVLISRLSLDVYLYIADNENLEEEKWEEFKKRFDDIFESSKNTDNKQLDNLDTDQKQS